MNEIEQAIKDFKNWKDSGYSKSETPNTYNLELAIQALEKQTPNGCIEFDGFKWRGLEAQNEQDN